MFGQQLELKGPVNLQLCVATCTGFGQIGSMGSFRHSPSRSSSGMLELSRSAKLRFLHVVNIVAVASLVNIFVSRFGEHISIDKPCSQCGGLHRANAGLIHKWRWIWQFGASEIG